jgi:hypothetical protein
MSVDKLAESGYVVLPQMNENDLEWFRSVINKSWKSRILELYPEKSKALIEHDITTYHEIREDLNHEKLWVKNERLFSRNDVEKLKSTDFFNNLTSRFGSFLIAAQTVNGKYERGTEEVYWRLVSPSVASDVGGPHADRWFHLIHRLSSVYDHKSLEFTTLKAWIPIFCEPERNGLLISKASHNRDWKFKTEIRNGVSYPIFDDNPAELDLKLVPTLPGQAIVFNEKLIHAGSINKGKFTRVSVEITMLFK